MNENREAEIPARECGFESKAYKYLLETRDALEKTKRINNPIVGISSNITLDY